MSHKHADYIYRNKHDSLRVRVHRRESGRWDYDVFYPSGKIATYSDEAGDDFATKRDALAEAKEQHGPLYAIAVEGNVTDSAWYRRASKRARTHGSTKKTPAAQLEREIADALAVGPPVTISVHEESDEETGEDTYTISDDGDEFDDVEESSVPDVQGDIDERRFHYQTLGRRIVLDAPERGWR